MIKNFQKGFSPIVVIIFVLITMTVGVVLVQQRTNILPFAQTIPEENDPRRLLYNPSDVPPDNAVYSPKRSLAYVPCRLDNRESCEIQIFWNLSNIPNPDTVRYVRIGPVTVQRDNEPINQKKGSFIMRSVTAEGRPLKLYLDDDREGWDNIIIYPAGYGNATGTNLNRVDLSAQIVKNECRGDHTWVELSWNDFPTYKYRLSRQDAPNGEFNGMGTTSDRYFGIRLVPNKSYNFKIEVLNGSSVVAEEIKSVQTASCTGTPTTKTEFTEKTLAYCNGNISRIHLEWKPITNAQFKLYRTTASQNGNTKIYDGFWYAYNDEPVTGGTVYSYQVETLLNGQTVLSDPKTLTAVSCP